jgi:hypothetical protein
MISRFVDPSRPQFFLDEISAAVEDFETLNPFGVGYEALSMVPMRERSEAMVELRRSLIHDCHDQISAAAKFLFVLGRGSETFNSFSPSAFEVTKLYHALNKEIRYGRKRMLPGVMILAATLINFDVKATAYWVPDALMNVDVVKFKHLQKYAMRYELYDSPPIRIRRSLARRFKVVEERDKMVLDSYKYYIKDEISEGFKRIVERAEVKAKTPIRSAVQHFNVPDEFEDCD